MPLRIFPRRTLCTKYSSVSGARSSLRRSGAMPPEIASSPWQRAQFWLYAEAPTSTAAGWPRYGFVSRHPSPSAARRLVSTACGVTSPWASAAPLQASDIANNTFRFSFTFPPRVMEISPGAPLQETCPLPKAAPEIAPCAPAWRMLALPDSGIRFAPPGKKTGARRRRPESALARRAGEGSEEEDRAQGERVHLRDLVAVVLDVLVHEFAGEGHVLVEGVVDPQSRPR